MTRITAGKIFSFIVAPLLLFCAGWYAHEWYYKHIFNKSEDRRIKLSGYQFISPLIDVELPEGYNVRHEPIPFKYKIKNFVDQQIKSGKVREMSVYFRDLSDGPWFGINEKEKYDAASMMKVPTMIAWLKRAEKDPALLQRKLTFNENTCPCPPQDIKPADTLKHGASYTIEELLRYMICFSDNKAMWLLHREIPDEEYGRIMTSMDVTNDPSEGHNFVTVHGYSGFLRILYNASFLNKEMSEKALQLLSFQDFPYGLTAGVPKGVKVAAKFGEYVDDKYPGLHQLHEFGIVYHPKGPYILGILTRGNNLAKQAEILKNVSEIVYNSVTGDASAHK
jgi:beta-lactamase class A